MKKPLSSYPPLIETLLSKDEGMFYELKGIRKESSELLESVVAFANSEGGYFILGIEDRNKAEGSLMWGLERGRYDDRSVTSKKRYINRLKNDLKKGKRKCMICV